MKELRKRSKLECNNWCVIDVKGSLRIWTDTKRRAHELIEAFYNSHNKSEHCLIVAKHTHDFKEV